MSAVLYTSAKVQMAKKLKGSMCKQKIHGEGKRSTHNFSH